MKRVLRYNSKRDVTVHSESNAEHTFALIFLAQYFLRVEPQASTFSHGKVYQMLFFHDFGEIKYGDVVTYQKTSKDRERELEAAQEIFASLPQPLDQVGYQLWQEFEVKQTPEARFANALDKIEPMFELLDPINEKSIKGLKITYEMHIGNKYKAAQDFPVLMRFLNVISNDMKHRGVFWENPVSLSK